MLSAERLREVIVYNREDGSFRWAISGPGKAKNGVAGGLHRDGYWHIRIDGTLYYGQRLAWLYVCEVWPIRRIRHRNGNRQDNRFANLKVTNRGNTRPIVSLQQCDRIDTPI